MNPQERAAQMCSLGKTRDAAVIPVLIQFLGDDEPISSPIGCWDSGDWSPLLQTFRQSSPGEEAAIALASMSDKAVVPLITALRDSSPSIRRNAAWAIGEIRDGDKINRSIALEPLIWLLKQDQDAWVRRAAAFALSELKDTRSAPALIDSLSDENAGVREMAANALGEMKQQSAADPLEIALKDSDPRVRDMARWALAEIADR
jgi:HEAT repeat protein